MAGRVFVVAQHSDNVLIGKRGFTTEEKENGIVLVFNPRMNFRWEDDAIHATLSFGARSEKCSIPVNDIIAIYSPEAHAQFITQPHEPVEIEDIEDESSKTENDEKSEKVVKVDFRKKKK